MNANASRPATRRFFHLKTIHHDDALNIGAQAKFCAYTLEEALRAWAKDHGSDAEGHMAPEGDAYTFCYTNAAGQVQNAVVALNVYQTAVADAWETGRKARRAGKFRAPEHDPAIRVLTAPFAAESAQRCICAAWTNGWDYEAADILADLTEGL